MNSFKLLLNISQSASTSDIVISGSNLQFENKYYSNDQSGLNQGIVTQFNVNQFLDNPINSAITNSFMVYLTGNSSQSEQIEILKSDKKLSNTFTNFYETTIINNLASPISYIDNNLTGTTEIDIYNYNYNLSDSVSIFGPLGTPVTISTPEERIGTEGKFLSTFTTEESFYLPIKINRNLVDSSVVNFSEYSRDKIVEIDSNPVVLSQGFVNINKELNDSVFWSDDSIISRIPKIPSVNAPDLPPPSSSDCVVFVTQDFIPEVWSCTIKTELISTSAELYEEFFNAPLDMSSITESGNFRDIISCTLIDPGQIQITEETCSGPCFAPNVKDLYSNWIDGDFFDLDYDKSSYLEEDYYDFYLTINRVDIIVSGSSSFREDLYLAGVSVTGDSITINPGTPNQEDNYLDNILRVNYNTGLSNNFLIQKQPYSVNFLDKSKYQNWFSYGDNPVDGNWAGVSNLNGQPTVYVNGLYPSESELIGAIKYPGSYSGENIQSTTSQEFSHNYDIDNVGFSTPVLYQDLSDSLVGEVTFSVNYTYNKFTTNNNGVEDKYYVLAGPSPENMRVVFRKKIDVLYTEEDNYYSLDEIGRYSVVPESSAYKIKEYIDDNVISFEEGDIVIGIMVVGQSNSEKIVNSNQNQSSSNTVTTANYINVPKQFSIKSIQTNCVI